MPILLAAVAINAIPVSLVVPMLPFLGQRYGASEFEVALLFTLMPLVGIVGNPLWGRLSDSIGRRRALTCTLGGTAVTFIAFAYADSLVTLYATRVMQGIFHGSVSIALAYVAVARGGQNRAKSMGQVFGAMGIGLAIGPAIGGILMGDDAATFSQTLPCLAAATLSVLAAISIFFFLPEPKQADGAQGGKTPSKGSQSGQLRAVFATPALWPLVAMIMISGFKMNAEQLAYPYWGISIDWTPQDVSFGFAVLSVAFLITTFGIIGPMTKRFGEERTLAIASTIDVIALCGFIVTSSTAWAFAWLFLLSLSSPLWGTILISVLSRHAPNGMQGTVQGLASSMQLFGRIVGTLIAGVVLGQFGYAGVYTLMAALITLVVIQAFRIVLEVPLTGVDEPSQ
ncbi:MAG: MFS transporter [Rhodospirillaceae bacterium]|jgi:MFS transporter, DHA1 family, tetracycline resistance protein|nr:MFS transporter [Rhodospirillaceae bacterium]